MDAKLLMMIGSALVLVGMLIITFSLVTRVAGSRGRSVGFILLGPIPIVWQGSRSLLVILPIAILIMLILFMVGMR